MTRVVCYSDFNCPFCYAMHEQLVESGTIAHVEWRGVQHASHLPVPMKVWQGGYAAELRQEVAWVKQLAPALAISVPPGKPSTRRAISAAAAALRQDARRGEEFVRALYAAFWRDGADLSDAVVLNDLMARSGIYMDSAPWDDKTIGEQVEQWDEAWRSTGHSGVPLLIGPEGDQLVGLVSSADVRRFMNRVGS
ncbi:MAG: DsbA family protein [Nitrospira sp.]